LLIKSRRLIAELPLSLGGEDVYSFLPVDYNGPTKMLYRGSKQKHFAIFSTQKYAIQAACAALVPHLGGYCDISLVAPKEGECVTHSTADEWIYEY